MALNYDFEGIDNDLMIHENGLSSSSPQRKGMSPTALQNRKTLDGFTRSNYNVYVKTAGGDPYLGSSRRER